jgi:hypothetical protein
MHLPLMQRDSRNLHLPPVTVPPTKPPLCIFFPKTTIPNAPPSFLLETEDQELQKDDE